MEEIWKDIKGYEGLYQISNLGRVKSLKRIVENNNRKYFTKERILKPIQIGSYYGVQLSVHGKSKKFYLHRLVCSTFIENIENKKCVNHKDGNKHNNKLENLEWCTHSENNHHSFNTNLNKNYGENNYNTIYTDEQVLNIRRLYKTGKYTQRELTKIYGMSAMTIHRIVKNKLRKRFFKWKNQKVSQK